MFERRRTLRTNTQSTFTRKPKRLNGYNRTGGHSTLWPATTFCSDPCSSLKTVNDVILRLESDGEEIGPTTKRFAVIAIAAVVFFVQVIHRYRFENASKTTLRTRISGIPDHRVPKTSRVATRCTCRVLQNGLSDDFSGGLISNRTRCSGPTICAGRPKEEIPASVATTVQRTSPLRWAMFSVSCIHFSFPRVADRFERHGIDYTHRQVSEKFDYLLLKMQ